LKITIPIEELRDKKLLESIEFNPLEIENLLFAGLFLEILYPFSSSSNTVYIDF
jgi:hypothetical protein